MRPNIPSHRIEQRRIVAYLGGLQAKVSVVRELQFPAIRCGNGSQSASGEELPPSFHFGDASQSALMPSVLDRAFKGEL